MCMETVLEHEVATTNRAIATERTIEAGSDEHLDLILELIDALRNIYTVLGRLNTAFASAFQHPKTAEYVPEIKTSVGEVKELIDRYENRPGFLEVIDKLRLEVAYTEELISDYNDYLVSPDQELLDIFNLL